MDETITPEQARQVREAHGLTREQVARVSGLGLRTVARFEAGDGTPNRSTERAIHQALKALVGCKTG